MSKTQLQNHNSIFANERYVVCNNKDEALVSYNTMLGKQAAYNYAKTALNHTRGNKLYYQGEDGENQLLECNLK